MNINSLFYLPATLVVLYFAYGIYLGIKQRHFSIGTRTSVKVSLDGNKAVNFGILALLFLFVITILIIFVGILNFSFSTTPLKVYRGQECAYFCK